VVVVHHLALRVPGVGLAQDAAPDRPDAHNESASAQADAAMAAMSSATGGQALLGDAGGDSPDDLTERCARRDARIDGRGCRCRPR